MFSAGLRKGYDAIDNIVSKIGNRLPIRLTIDPAIRPRDHNSFGAYAERIRATFRLHKPSIIVGSYIGTGGFADVFRAFSDYDGETQFAIKILRTDLLEPRKGPEYDRAEEEMRIKDVKKRFRNESFVQWHLSQSVSPEVPDSVVRVFDHGEYDTQHDFRFILMELMGFTLRDFINERSNFDNDHDLLVYKSRLMRSVAQAITVVHSQGIFHRDIKPENILFPRGILPGPARRPEPEDEEAQIASLKVKLGDFGTVRWVRSYSDQFDGVIIGSQFYMSPEQIFHPGHIDERTDIYSFGIVCYELLYGHHPKNIDRNTPDVLKRMAMTKAVRRTPPVGFERLDEIIFGCLSDLKRRPQTMEAVLADLSEFCQRFD